MADQRCRFLQRRDRLVTGHGGEVIEEPLQAVASLEIVEKRLQGNSRPLENGLSVHDLRIGVHGGNPDLVFAGHLPDSSRPCGVANLDM